MSTNACLWGLHGPDGGIAGTTTATDDTLTEGVDNVSSLSLYKVALGKTLTHFHGSYTAGSGVLMVYNTTTRMIKVLEAMTMPKGMQLWPLENPIVVEQNDIVYLYTTAAGT